MVLAISDGFSLCSTATPVTVPTCVLNIPRIKLFRPLFLKLFFIVNSIQNLNLFFSYVFLSVTEMVVYFPLRETWKLYSVPEYIKNGLSHQMYQAKFINHHAYVCCRFRSAPHPSLLPQQRGQRGGPVALPAPHRPFLAGHPRPGAGAPLPARSPPAAADTHPAHQLATREYLTASLLAVSCFSGWLFSKSNWQLLYCRKVQLALWSWRRKRSAPCWPRGTPCPPACPSPRPRKSH